MWKFVVREKVLKKVLVKNVVLSYWLEVFDQDAVPQYEGVCLSHNALNLSTMSFRGFHKDARSFNTKSCLGQTLICNNDQRRFRWKL